MSHKKAEPIADYQAMNPAIFKL